MTVYFFAKLIGTTTPMRKVAQNVKNLGTSAKESHIESSITTHWSPDGDECLALLQSLKSCSLTMLIPKVKRCRMLSDREIGSQFIPKLDFSKAIFVAWPCNLPQTELIHLVVTRSSIPCGP